jgi:hypothetical protein
MFSELIKVNKKTEIIRLQTKAFLAYTGNVFIISFFHQEQYILRKTAKIQLLLEEFQVYLRDVFARSAWFYTACFTDFLVNLARERLIKWSLGRWYKGSSMEKIKEGNHCRFRHN